MWRQRIFWRTALIMLFIVLSGTAGWIARTGCHAPTAVGMAGVSIIILGAIVGLFLD